MTPRARKYIGADISDRLRERQGGRCAVCGETMTRQPDNPDARPMSRAVAMTPLFETIDHIVPLAKNGTDDESNLQLACGRCNRKKGAR